MPTDDKSSDKHTSAPPTAGKGAGGADPGQRGATPGGHYENTDHGYGTGIKANAGDAPAADPTYGAHKGEYDGGQRHNDTPDPAAPVSGSKPANEEERHADEHGSESASEGYQNGPKGGEGVFGSNAPFGGGPDQGKEDTPPVPKK